MLYQKKRVNFAPEIGTTACRQKGSFFSGLSQWRQCRIEKKDSLFFLFHPLFLMSQGFDLEFKI